MTTFLRFLIALVLLAASSFKLMDLPGFVLVLRSYRFLPIDLLWPIGIAITASEVVVGLWLLSGRLMTRAALASASLHTLYAGCAGFILVRGTPILNCGCFGSYLARPLSFTTVLENLVLVALSLALFAISRRRNGRGKVQPGEGI
ncbi:MAG TPA: MauE/DoxX family redox-associated membrane protein [Geobacteraceae bacterium]